MPSCPFCRGRRETRFESLRVYADMELWTVYVRVLVPHRTVVVCIVYRGDPTLCAKLLPLARNLRGRYYLRCTYRIPSLLTTVLPWYSTHCCRNGFCALFSSCIVVGMKVQSRKVTYNAMAIWQDKSKAHYYRVGKNGRSLHSLFLPPTDCVTNRRPHQSFLRLLCFHSHSYEALLQYAPSSTSTITPNVYSYSIEKQLLGEKEGAEKEKSFPTKKRVGWVEVK